MSDEAEFLKLSVEEYLKYEESSDIRHEYIAGQLFAMSGATLGHECILLGASKIGRH